MNIHVKKNYNVTCRTTSTNMQVSLVFWFCKLEVWERIKPGLPIVHDCKRRFDGRQFDPNWILFKIAYIISKLHILKTSF